MDLEGLIWGLIPTYVCKKKETAKASVGIDGLLSVISILDLANTKQDFCQMTVTLDGTRNVIDSWFLC